MVNVLVRGTDALAETGSERGVVALGLALCSMESACPMFPRKSPTGAFVKHGVWQITGRRLGGRRHQGSDTEAPTDVRWRPPAQHKHMQSADVLEFFFFGSHLGKLAKLSYPTVLERVLRIRNQSSPVLRLSHSSVW